MRLMKIFFLNENLDKALDLLAHFIYGIYHIWYVLHESCTSLRMLLRASYLISKRILCNFGLNWLYQ